MVVVMKEVLITEVIYETDFRDVSICLWLYHYIGFLWPPEINP